MKHFINIQQLSQTQLVSLLEQAQALFDHNKQLLDRPILNGKTLATIFCEPSTRSHCSFSLAAQKLGMHILELPANSSLAKAESLQDTLLTLQAMGSDGFVIRHSQAGIMQQIASYLASDTVLVNAGEGDRSHPSQALLDMLTIRQHYADFSSLRIAIIGDSKHSRVAHSNIAALQLLGVSDIRLVAPESLLMEIETLPNIGRYTEAMQGLSNADIIIVLRVQKERFSTDETVDLEHYIKHYQLNKQRLAYAKINAIIMHPGPMNQGIEISADVANHPRSVIQQQVRNGVAVRMALLQHLFGYS